MREIKLSPHLHKVIAIIISAIMVVVAENATITIIAVVVVVDRITSFHEA